MPLQYQVRDYMTFAPHSIPIEQTLEAASHRMRELGICYLPVVREGVLSGVLSEHDLTLVGALDLDLAEVTIEEVLTSEPLTLTEDTPVARAARAMAAHKADCAVVMQGKRLVGLFTKNDAIRVLAELIEADQPESLQMTPSQVRSVILSEHVNIRALLLRSEEHAQRILSGGGFGDQEVLSLRGIAYQLYTGLCRHMELENRLLAPALAALDAFGKVRSDRLIAEHVEQRRSLERIVAQFDEPSEPPAAMAAALAHLITTFRQDMDIEEQMLLHPSLLCDDLIAQDAEAG